jgi:hypothetical protein
MTPDEYRHSLNQLTSDQLATFRGSWGGARRTVDECVREFVYAKDAERSQWETTIIFHLEGLGIFGLKTEAQKGLEYAQETSAATARAADAAVRSAGAAESSAKTAKMAVRASYLSIIAALVAIVAALAAKC